MGNLVHRMRRFATDVLGGQGIGLRFRSTVGDDGWKIGADARRQLYLISRNPSTTSLGTPARGRSRCELDALRDGLALLVADDGRGFDPSAEHEGNGLRSMRKRARAMGGGVELVSSPGNGTRLTVTVHLDRKTPLSMLRVKGSGIFR